MSALQILLVLGKINTTVGSEYLKPDYLKSMVTRI